MSSTNDAEGRDQPKKSIKLTDRQKARIERNRQKALLLKQARVANRPYSKVSPQKLKGQSKVIDSGAGFFIEEDEEEEMTTELQVKHEPGPIVEVDNLLCEDCDKEFVESYLYNSFDKLVCDNCRQNEDRHPLITRTDAKNKYLLKDADFDRREPALRFILRKNPHNPRWGEMKLYLESQVHARALEVWESEEKIEEELEKRNENKEKAKQKKYDKKMKALRMSVRSSLWRKESDSHVHEFGEEEFEKDEDVYSKTCKTCGHKMTYEKM
ncbi:DNA repair protein complementing XP-A cells homolog [Liolophura sinensis]|uniref:DNA repair protein complementing XP-A cells homolog n=1 Tax=Liolophura sinensis TaxID=3198878 RepID=UPI0031593C9C